ncbi:MAG: DUF547 domain-containing protein, partial [Burkholderiales bacterium]
GLVAAIPMAHAQFDQSHGAFTTLLKKHVVLGPGAHASQVRYAELLKDRPALKSYLESLSKVTEAEFKTWTKPQQLAFLMNAYNGYTLELILTRYPNLKSIRDFGYIPKLTSVWDKWTFPLLGKEISLNGVEHDTIRVPGVYDDPRIHFAVNCASIGCPMLREEAFVAERLDAQLDEQAARFLADRSRNRVSADGTLEVSKIFDWYKGDFEKGLKGIKSREAFFAKYAKSLTDNVEHQKLVVDGKAAIRTLDYDWSLNDAKR